MAKKNKTTDIATLEEHDDRSRPTVSTPVIRAEESPNRIVLRRKVNRPRPGDKVGYRPIVL